MRLHLTALLLLASCSAPGAPVSPGENDAPSDWLDGREKSILVVGYSTSYAWPTMLQEMLDEHAGGERRYHVLNAVVGGAPVELWRAPEDTESFERTMGAMLRDFFGPGPRLRAGEPAPELAICQQSLQFTGEELYGDRRGPVKTEHDMVGAELGADAIEQMVLRLHDLGIEDVVVAMHIYKEPVEPEVGNERIALARLLDRGHDFVHGGPDLWTITRDAYPECFEDDGVHPNELGTKLMAEAWYRTLAGTAAREEVVERLHERDYDHVAMMRAYMAWRREGGETPRSILR